MVLIFLSLYCILLLTLHVGWQRAIRDRNNDTAPFYPMISVVIAFRNEQENLSKILNDLRQQDYGNYEVILVNDHSRDESLHIAEQHRFASVSLIQNKKAGKKAALASGIELAKGEIIVTTDADCRLGKHWLESIRQSFSNPATKFAFGAVAIGPQPNFFSALQSVELASLIASGAATCGLGVPTLCNGANLAFRRETFYLVGGYRGNEHIASGDDEFLMRKVLKAYPGGVKFIPSKAAVVQTEPQKSFGGFVNQRLRWAGKWRYNTSVLTVMLAFFIFSLQVAVIAGILSIINSFNYSLLLLLFVKLLLEAGLIGRVCRLSNIHMSWPALLMLQVCYPLYVILIGTASNFVTPLWKERRVQTERK